VAPVTSASSVVSGNEVGLTNIMLQQLAICVALHRQRCSSASSSGNHDTESTRRINTVANPATPATAIGAAIATSAVDVWPTLVGVMVSTDGINWTPFPTSDPGPQRTSLSNSIEKYVVRGNVEARRIRVYPIAWESSDGDRIDLRERASRGPGQHLRTGAALRVDVYRRTVRTAIDPPTSVLNSPSTRISSPVKPPDGDVFRGDRVQSFLDTLQEVVLVIIAAIAYLAKAEEARRLRKQEDMRKVSVKMKIAL
jgi:hypothetical protein